MAQQLESAPFSSHSLSPPPPQMYGLEGESVGGARVNVREKGPIRVAEPSPLSTSYPFDYKGNPF